MERNPNHKTTRTLHDHWHKVATLIMLKLGKDEVRIEASEIDELLNRPGGVNIVCDDRDNALTFRIVNDAEGARLAREAGGTRDQN